MTLLLGCIADDFTGATDLANNLVRAGMRVVQTIGVPAPGLSVDADAVVVALKSRTCPVQDARQQSITAARWLRGQGAGQIYFKVCSTFDSTAAGNIGPVTDALMDELGADFAIVTPAFPENGRTVFKGHLFVGEQLLSESPMRNHPLTPMTDANLVRVMQAQMPVRLAQPAPMQPGQPRGPVPIENRQRRVGLIDHRVVAQGAAAVRERIAALQREGHSLAIADAVSDADLHVLAQASAELRLVVAGSGLAIGIPALHGLAPSASAAQLPIARGTRAIVSGSCSAATIAQVADFIAAGGAAFAVDPLQAGAGRDIAAEALAWARARMAPSATALNASPPPASEPPIAVQARATQQPAAGAHAALLIYATAQPLAVQAVQAQLGAERAGAMVEAILARVALGLVEAGVGQLIFAGGETSGACVQALGITQLRIGPQIDAGVPWCHAAEQGLHLALKSGNFGGVDFFTRAFESL